MPLVLGQVPKRMTNGEKIECLKVGNQKIVMEQALHHFHKPKRGHSVEPQRVLLVPDVEQRAGTLELRKQP